MRNKKKEIEKILRENDKKKMFVPKKRGNSYTDKFVSVMLGLKEHISKPEIVLKIMSICDIDSKECEAVLELERKVRIQLNIIISNSKSTTVSLSNNPIYKDLFHISVIGKGMMSKYKLIAK